MHRSLLRKSLEDGSKVAERAADLLMDADTPIDEATERQIARYVVHAGIDLIRHRHPDLAAALVASIHVMADAVHVAHRAPDPDAPGA